MNKKVASKDPVIKDELKEALSDYPTKKDIKDIFKNFPTKGDLKVELRDLEFRTDEKARQYRDEILTRLDGVMGELVQMREDRVFEEHDVKVLQESSADHEKRITKLESSQQTS